MDGTVTEEKIYHMAGAQTPDALSVLQLHHLIRTIGREPAERNTTYDRITFRREADLLA
jgi:aminodeoxyfutalosine synthase